MEWGGGARPCYDWEGREKSQVAWTLSASARPRSVASSSIISSAVVRCMFSVPASSSAGSCGGGGGQLTLRPATVPRPARATHQFADQDDILPPDNVEAHVEVAKLALGIAPLMRLLQHEVGWPRA